MPSNRKSYSRAYYAKHRARILSYYQKYYLAHTEQMRAASKKSYDKRKNTKAFHEKRVEYMTAYYQRPYARERRNAYERVYRKWKREQEAAAKNRR